MAGALIQNGISGRSLEVDSEREFGSIEADFTQFRTRDATPVGA